MKAREVEKNGINPRVAYMEASVAQEETKKAEKFKELEKEAAKMAKTSEYTGMQILRAAWKLYEITKWDTEEICCAMKSIMETAQIMREDPMTIVLGFDSKGVKP